MHTSVSRVLLVASLALGCGTRREPPPRTPEPRPVAKPVQTDPHAEAPHPDEFTATQMFDLAEQALVRGDLDEAERRYREVIQTYAFSKLRVTAEIRLADIAAVRREFAAAIELYETWLREHPSPSPEHDEVEAKKRAVEGGASP